MLLVGKINGIFGIKGWVKIFSNTEPKNNICQYLPLYIQKTNLLGEISIEKLAIKECKAHSKTIIASIANINDCDSARELLGLELYINKSQLPQTANNEYYWSDLITMKVINKQQDYFGKVKYLFNNGINDIMVVADNDIEYLIPFTKQYTLNINTKDKVIVVDWQQSWQ